MAKRGDQQEFPFLWGPPSAASPPTIAWGIRSVTHEATIKGRAPKKGVFSRGRFRLLATTSATPAQRVTQGLLDRWRKRERRQEEEGGPKAQSRSREGGGGGREEEEDEEEEEEEEEEEAGAAARRVLLGQADSLYVPFVPTLLAVPLYVLHDGPCHPMTCLHFGPHSWRPLPCGAVPSKHTPYHRFPPLPPSRKHKALQTNAFLPAASAFSKAAHLVAKARLSSGEATPSGLISMLA